MAMNPGTKLGPYEILAPLGAGGMGEVYRARDTRLGREVAVKVLPQHLSSNPEVRARFEREAKTVSSLNHPHICTLFDVGREGDTDFLVMELIEGETLATRLVRGALPVADVARLGVQIADALDRAHRAGIVHRDLKPGNIMLTRGGAKLMDFGLARATGLAGPGTGSGVTMAALTQSPTVAQPLTAEGTLVGTFQYMSPEQLEGKEADERSDIWALGCVLYEMVTGQRAFDGKSQASLIGAIMNTQPVPVSQVVTLAPPALDRLVLAMLAKDPADRVQSAHDVKLHLAWLADAAPATSSAALPLPGVSAAVKRSRWPLFAGVGIGAAAVTAAMMLLLPRGGAGPVVDNQPERYVVGSADLSPTASPVISPDGTYIVISASEGGTRRLYRRRLSSFEMEAIPGTEDGNAPFFSPDGAWIGFMTPNAIKKIPAQGGVAQVVAPEPRVNGGDWGRDGMIYFTPREGGGGLTALARVPAAGGTPETVAVVDTAAGENEAWLPEILPDGKTVLISMAGGASAWHLVAVSADGSKRELVQNAILARYMSTGHLLYADLTSQAVLVAPFDAARAEITGPAVPLTEPIDANYAFDANENGTLVYIPVPGAGVGAEVVWLDRKGAATPVLDTRASWTQPRLSPDGRHLLLRKTATECEIWTYDIERQSLARVVQGGDNHDAVWAPDGRRVAYEQASAGGKMVVLTVEGAREVVTLTSGSDRGRPQSWSGGGNVLVYSVTGRGTNTDIWIARMDEDGRRSPFLASPFDETDPAISPDGKWIAYVTDESGAKEVFVRAVPDNGMAYQVSIGGGSSPLWSRDGKELFYVSGTKMMAVAVDTAPVLRAGKPEALFADVFSTGRARDFDVAPDGRFVAVRVPGGAVGQRELRVLRNWPAELRRVSGDGATSR
jgi:Tol biopolymer transport system component